MVIVKTAGVGVGVGEATGLKGLNMGKRKKEVAKVLDGQRYPCPA